MDVGLAGKFFVVVSKAGVVIVVFRCRSGRDAPSPGSISLSPHSTHYHPPAPQDQFDTIDLSDNDVRKLDGFPLLKRLKTLYLNNCRIM